MKENGFEYVDLGLPSGTMWATCNVGATKPEDEGLLFQFGRTDGYKYGDKNHKFRTDYKTTTSGKAYKTNEILDLSDDAAHVNMGGKWRMPTGSYNPYTGQYEGEWAELINNTTHKIETINGVKGMMFTSNINGHQLFIPFMQGYWYNGKWEDWGRTFANVLSSQVNDSYIYRVYSLNCELDGTTNIYDYYRANVFSVRGVFKK